MRSKYLEIGIDVKKKGIEVFKYAINNLFPHAFCVVTRDPGMPLYGLVTHTDSAGSKPIIAYLNWRESDNLSWFKGLAQDVLAMNINDIICVGAKPINFIDYIALNPFKVPKIDLLKVLSSEFEKSLSFLENQGFKVQFSGGETAELPDQIKTLDISGVVNGRVNIQKAITGENVKPGDLIIGLRSGGKTKYEKKINSGIMCNGLSLARRCLLKREYQREYPEIYSEEGQGYYGRFEILDHVDEIDMTIGEALTSPMRFFIPLVDKIQKECSNDITGLVHNMGGGLTKCLRIGRNINYVKEDLIQPDPIFTLIQKESNEKWKAMFENFNMGTGFEVIIRPSMEERILNISERFGLEAKTIGKCKKSHGTNLVTIISRWGKFVYK